MSFQDQGRIQKHSWLEYGVAPAGYMDAFSAIAANTLVHNLSSDTVIEMLFGGQSIQVLEDCWLAHVGSNHCQQLTSWSARFCLKGETLHFKTSPIGIWSYLATPEGWHTSNVFQSHSRHERSDLGEKILPNSILKGNSLLTNTPNRSDKRYTPHQDRRDYNNPPPLRLYKGPHSHLFSNQQINHLVQQTWQVDTRSDRTGYRLRSHNDTLLEHEHSIHSCPSLVGSIQIPPSGQPIVTLHDGPTVGGYPIIARMYSEDISWLVQQQPFQPIQFTYA